MVATHGGAAAPGIGRLLGLPVEHWTVLGGLVNCAWSVLEEQPDGRWRLVEHNARSLPEEVVGDEAWPAARGRFHLRRRLPVMLLRHDCTGLWRSW